VTSLLHRRELTYAFLCWSGYVVLWMVTAGSAVGVAVLWWLVGVIVFASVWIATQPLFQRWRDGAEAAKQRLHPPANR
jgi:hypothetical protein